MKTRRILVVISVFTLYEYMTNLERDQLPVGFLVQLVEHCTGITDDMGSNLVQA